MQKNKFTKKDAIYGLIILAYAVMLLSLITLGFMSY